MVDDIEDERGGRWSMWGGGRCPPSTSWTALMTHQLSSLLWRSGHGSLWCQDVCSVPRWKTTQQCLTHATSPRLSAVLSAMSRGKRLACVKNVTMGLTTQMERETITKATLFWNANLANDHQVFQMYQWFTFPVVLFNTGCINIVLWKQRSP